MIASQRFYINKDRYIVDQVNAANNGLTYVPGGALEDEPYLREYLLEYRLKLLLRNLIAPHEKNKKFDNQYHQLVCALQVVLSAIGATLLQANNHYGSQRRNNDVSNDKSEGLQDYTSVALFVGDVVRILRDLYGEFDEYAVKKISRAVLHLMQRYTSESLRDLWREHENAETVDYGWYGLGVLPDEGISSSQFARANSAARKIRRRARAIRRDRFSFGKYTVRFAEIFDERWRSGSP